MQRARDEFLARAALAADEHRGIRGRHQPSSGERRQGRKTAPGFILPFECLSSRTPGAALKSHAWPGNVRELRNAMERLAVLATGPSLGAEDFQRYCLSPVVEERADAEPLSLAEAERLAIERALSASDGNKTQASRLLGITPKTLNAKLALYNKA